MPLSLSTGLDTVGRSLEDRTVPVAGKIPLNNKYQLKLVQNTTLKILVHYIKRTPKIVIVLASNNEYLRAVRFLLSFLHSFPRSHTQHQPQNVYSLLYSMDPNNTQQSTWVLALRCKRSVRLKVVKFFSILKSLKIICTFLLCSKRSETDLLVGTCTQNSG